jgi:hypothetical protein
LAKLAFQGSRLISKVLALPNMPWDILEQLWTLESWIALSTKEPGVAFPSQIMKERVGRFMVTFLVTTAQSSTQWYESLEVMR